MGVPGTLVLSNLENGAVAVFECKSPMARWPFLGRVAACGKLPSGSLGAVSQGFVAAHWEPSSVLRATAPRNKQKLCPLLVSAGHAHPAPSVSSQYRGVSHVRGVPLFSWSVGLRRSLVSMEGDGRADRFRLSACQPGAGCRRSPAHPTNVATNSKPRLAAAVSERSGSGGRVRTRCVGGLKTRGS